MADYKVIKDAIKTAIKQNNAQEITGDVLQQNLLAIINSLGVGYQFFGVATPDTNPGATDARVFYIAAENGTYSNFDGIEIKSEVAILAYSTRWEKISTGIVSVDKLNEFKEALLNISHQVTEEDGFFIADGSGYYVYSSNESLDYVIKEVI